ncbi:MAG: hypothetical protein KTR31_06350 [Myxococcales bacterium]|nr:hypothetical protein [Myxococcales bacterium]
MVDVDPDDPRIPARPLWGLVILSLPVFGVIAVFIAYGIMWSLGLSGRAASGEPVELAFEGCAEARALLEARLQDMGLSEGEWSDTVGGFAVRTPLMGDPDVDGTVPDTLAMPGALEIRGGDEVLATNVDLSDATVRLDIFMVPYVLLRLHEDAAKRVRDHMRSDPRGQLRFWVDGVDVGWQSNSNPVALGELELSPNASEDVDEQDRMQQVAAWSVVLDHAPLPCDVRPVR